MPHKIKGISDTKYYKRSHKKTQSIVSRKLEKLGSHAYTALLPINSCMDVVVRKPPDYCVCKQTKTGYT